MKRCIDDLKNLKGKKVLVRCDFNVPREGDKITDDTRIRKHFKTIDRLTSQGCVLILCSHLGKPKTDEDKKKCSLNLVAQKAQEVWNKKVLFVKNDNVVGDNVREAINNSQNSDIILLENTRFRKEETNNDDKFSQELASLADIYVNDAFGSAHRAHCSTVGVAKYVKESAIGYLMQKEIEVLSAAMYQPNRPFVAVIGGAKVSDKINVINNLINKVDKLIIGGGMAYTFLASQGYEVGLSLFEESKLSAAKEIFVKAHNMGVELLLPIDITIVKNLDNTDEFNIVDSDSIPKDYMGVDIGSKTSAMFAEALSDAKTIIWNGPMGIFEIDNFAKGTLAVANAISKLNDVTSIVGGGDSIAAINKLKLSDKITHISTGGGATLAFLEGKTLPGIAAIQDKL
jgi:phosphoglycerate kinase